LLAEVAEEHIGMLVHKQHLVLAAQVAEQQVAQVTEDMALQEPQTLAVVEAEALTHLKVTVVLADQE
jgi:hypothetical protein